MPPKQPPKKPLLAASNILSDTVKIKDRNSFNHSIRNKNAVPFITRLN